MSRGLSANNITAVTSNTTAPVLFAELDFASGFVRCHSGIGTISWGGYDWLGVGTFGIVSAVEDSSDLQRKTMTYTLNGIPTEMISLVLSQQYQGRTANLYLGFIDRTTGIFTDTPFIIDKGKMDISTIEEGATLSVTVSAESRMAAWDRPIIRRYTNAEQQSRFAGDLGLEYIDKAAVNQVYWGRKAE